MTFPSDRHLSTWLDVANEAALSAGAVLQHYWGNLNDINEKGRSGDLVTEADKAAEAAVMAVMERHLPSDHGFLAEESGSFGSATSPFLWAIDPQMAPPTTPTNTPFARYLSGCCSRASRFWESYTTQF